MKDYFIGYDHCTDGQIVTYTWNINDELTDLVSVHVIPGVRYNNGVNDGPN